MRGDEQAYPAPGAQLTRASLKGPGAILLVSCYELGHQPLSLASPLALLEEAGYAPATLDLAVERLDPARLAAARFVAVAVPMHTALRLGTKAAGRIRALNPDCHLCFYGMYASLNGEALLERFGADSVIGGEFEAPLLRLVESLESGAAIPGIDRADPAPVPGVGTRGRPAAPWLGKIRFAVPRRAALPPLDRYAKLEYDGEVRLAGQVEASRGCLHLCRHCPIPPVYGGRFFIVPRDVVLTDIRNQVARGARHITFGDPDFLNGPGHSLAIVRAMRAAFPAPTFDFTAKIEHLLRHRTLLPELARLGCLFIVSAVESLSDRVLAILDKGHTRADVLEALRLVRGAGIALRPSLLPFTPWSTLDDYLDLLGFVERHDLVDAIDPVQLAIRLLIPPESLLADRPEMQPYLGPLDPERFTFTWTHPDARMDRLYKEVSKIVEQGTHDEEDPRVTFQRIRARAVSPRAEQIPPALLAGPVARRDKGRPPRLTEPWFC